jgi:hypothetical protein
LFLPRIAIRASLNEKAGRIRDLRMMTSDLRVGALGAIMHYHTIQTYSTFAVKMAEAQPGNGSPALPAQRRLRGIMQSLFKSMSDRCSLCSEAVIVEWCPVGR